MQILVADDHGPNRLMLEALLKGAGYGVITAENGIVALEKLRSSRVDGIVSDILMPKMDGFRLIRQCKKDPLLQQIPFIFYTATYTDQKDEEFGLSLGAIRYIIKPMKPAELLKQINEAFLEHGRSPRDFTKYPVPDEESFNREYSFRVGKKLEKKERELQESEEKYRLLYENSMDAILLTSEDGSIQAANPAACAMFQRTEEEIIRNGREGIVDITDSRLPGALEERSRTGVFEGELTFLRKDGSRFPGEISSRIFIDRNGKRRSSMIIRDVTDRKKAEDALLESERRFREVVQDQTELIVRFRPDGTVLFVNDAFLSNFSKKPEEVTGNVFHLPVHEEDREKYHTIMEGLTRNDPFGTLEFRIYLADGSIQWLHWNLRAFFDNDGRVDQFQAVGSDITERRENERIIRESYVQIEQNLQQFAILNDHIRNPLTVIMMLVEMDEAPSCTKILEQVHEIDRIISQLDRGFLESEKIRGFLKKHYGIGEISSNR